MTQESPLATPTPWNLLASAYEAETLPSLRHFAEEALRLAAPPPGAPWPTWPAGRAPSRCSPRPGATPWTRSTSPRR